MTDMRDQPDRDEWPPPGPAPWPAPGPGQPASGYRPGGYGPGGPAGPDLIEQGRRRRPRRSLAVYLLVAVLAAGIGAASVWLGHSGAPVSVPTAPPGTGAPAAAVSSARERAVAAAVRPGLVDIASRLGYQGGQAAATGMIISPGGLVLTNNHVIADTTGLTAVVVPTQRHFTVRWLGYDKADDVAVLQLVGASGLRTVPLGNSARTRAGQRVVALGNAEGLGGAPAVAGVITRTNQTVTASDDGGSSTETLHGMLETDAAIVPGDSGGSLVSSSSGRVIGMDTAAAAGPGDGARDAGFAIPINRALAIARLIVAGQAGARIHVGSTGFLGVLIPSQRASQLTSPAAQRRRQLQQYAGGAAPSAGAGCISTNQTAGVPSSVAPARAGALVLGRLCGTPASHAGISAGDVITRVDRHPVTTPSSLTAVMQRYRAGARAAVTWVDLSGRQQTATLVLGQAPPQ
jgi:S1-C subfamily serine protease